MGKETGVNATNYRHGFSGTAEYRAYNSMKNRCTNKNSIDYKYYGERGIKFMFTNFNEFLNDVGPRPSKMHSIDRINNDGNYEIGNCRWATKEVQSNNTRANYFITNNGETKTQAQWSKELNIAQATIHNRVTAGYSNPLIKKPVLNFTTSFHKNKKKWISYVFKTVNSVKYRKYIGYFYSKEEAQYACKIFLENKPNWHE